MLTGLVCESDRYIWQVIQNNVLRFVIFPVISVTLLYSGTTLLQSECNNLRRPA